MKNSLTLLIVLFFVVTQIFAQEAPKVKFEKVSEEELKMTVYEQDTTAEAVILFDDGQSYVKFETQEDQFILTYDRFVRIKILKQSGTSWGNFSIPIYSSVQNKEDLVFIKGVTSNLENGKIVKTDMKKESVFQERENKYWEKARLSLPSVKVGSVIDLKYEIRSPFLWNLREWNFQYLIPVKWSQYRVVYPEYFVYNHSSMGYHRLNSNDQSTGTESINYTTSSETSGSGFGSGGQRTMKTNTISYQTNIYKYSAKEVPAMKEEPYLTTLDNYTTKMKFELAVKDYTKIGGKYESYTNSWNDIARELLDDEDFGGQIKSANYTKDVIASLIAGKTDEKQKMIALYNFIQHNIKWDGFRRYMPSKSLRKAFNDKSGNSAEINLLLIAMLKEAGIDANPVILSTRSNGIISPTHASISDCNYVIASALINGVPVLLDATEPNLPAGLIPFRCLNGQGRLIKRDNVEEVGLTNVKSGSVTMASVEFKDGKFTGNIISSETALNAFDFREAVKDAGGQKEYFDNLKNKSAEIQYVDYSYTNLDSIYLPVQKKYQITLQNEAEPDAEIIYLNPVLVDRITKNPFTSPTREYPVDYGVPSSEIYQLNLIIPEGYKVEELPQSKAFALAGKGASFIYKVVQNENSVSFSMRLTIDKTLFVPDEYKDLQEFYNIVVAKESEQIVLKKISK
jgi:hypothetical protein